MSNKVHIHSLLDEARQMVIDMRETSDVRAMLIDKATLAELDDIRKLAEKREHAADETIVSYIRWIADQSWTIIMGSN